MIPIRDTTPSKTYPVINTAIIGLNILVFIYQTFLVTHSDLFVFTYGFVPARFSNPEYSSYYPPGSGIFSLFSFMFLHGGFWHILGNMWSLYIFGDNVEDRLGPFRYLLFYILCGLTSAAAQFITNIHSSVPVIGASGAIAGVMGAYFILYPHSKILTLIPIIFIPYFMELPAFLFLGFWFLLQFINAAGSSGQSGGIAWWAHVGGFFAGIVFLKIFLSIPLSGLSERAKKAIRKKKSHRFQVIHPVTSLEHLDIHGSITISPFEAVTGTHKVINIPKGFQRRLFRVSVPPNTGEGKTLRLKGLGKTDAKGRSGDLLLHIFVEPDTF